MQDLNNKTLYRKYRPKTFDEMYGQEVVVKTLSNAISNNRIGHSYIFAGNKGSGKTSCAKIVARAVNCLKPNNGNPCNQCANCLSILNNSSIDLIELDAASNNGVNEIRSINESTNYLPSQLKYKVYIIDEAHMLTNNSWNALLKTIEEPPSYVIFIFATTEYHKIPATIISRCQRYDFYKIDKVSLTKLIKDVCQKEQIKIDEQSVEAIVQLSDGAARDALSVLDQLCSFNNNQISIDLINKLFGTVNIETQINLLNLIEASNLKEVMKQLKEFSNSGINFQQLVNSLLDILIDKVIQLKTNSFENLKRCNQDNIKKINFIDINKINQLMDIFVALNEKLKYFDNQEALVNSYFIKAIELFDNQTTSINNFAEPQPTQTANNNVIPTASIKAKKPEPEVEQPKVSNPWAEQKLKQQVVSPSSSSIKSKTSQFNLEDIKNKNEKQDDDLELPNITSPFKTKELVVEETPKQNTGRITVDIDDEEPSLFKSYEEAIKNIIDYDEEFKQYFFAIVHNRNKELNNNFNDIFNSVKLLGSHQEISINKFLHADQFLITSQNGAIVLFKSKTDALRFNELANDIKLHNFFKEYFKQDKLLIGVDIESAKEFKNEYKKIQTKNIKDVKINTSENVDISTQLLDILNEEGD